jgi:hypothetical protein
VLFTVAVSTNKLLRSLQEVRGRKHEKLLIIKVILGGKGIRRKEFEFLSERCVFLNQKRGDVSGFIFETKENVLWSCRWYFGSYGNSLIELGDLNNYFILKYFDNQEKIEFTIELSSLAKMVKISSTLLRKYYLILWRLSCLYRANIRVNCFTGFQR